MDFSSKRVRSTKAIQSFFPYILFSWHICHSPCQLMQRSNVILLTDSYLITSRLGKKYSYVGGLVKFLMVLFWYKRSLVKEQSYKSYVICYLFFYYFIGFLYMSRRKQEAGSKFSQTASSFPWEPETCLYFKDCFSRFLPTWP